MIYILKGVKLQGRDIFIVFNLFKLINTTYERFVATFGRVLREKNILIASLISPITKCTFTFMFSIFQILPQQICLGSNILTYSRSNARGII
jgi:hypothetical protein